MANVNAELAELESRCMSLHYLEKDKQPGDINWS